MIDARGGAKPHWETVTRILGAMPAEEYARRIASGRRMIRENGVTYNVYDDEAGQERPWQLDGVPFVIAPREWKTIEAAVIQRARLADAILRDIYGPQRLVRDGHLPPHLVYGHPQFLRALKGARPADGVHVHLYSVDLTRDEDGAWTVLASRADAPSGLGYALENRVVVSQTFPELFGALHVERLAAFFQAFRDSVLGLAHSSKGHTVLLTPGPFNEAYFEHAYLAHYLGLEMVEGEDLAARDGQVFLRTLGGLARVAVVFRRLDSDFCDPLEFRADSALGVPGLAEVVRAGGVVLANALGGGVVESPALDAFLPAISRALFDEDLLISDVPTVWCGTESGRRQALARLAHGVARNAFDARPLFSRNSTARAGSDMTPEDIARFTERITRRGATKVVQDASHLGRAPVFENGKFGARPMSLRVFAAWTPNGYIAMPGGLARIARDDSATALSMQSGAASKDVWVLADGPVNDFSLLAPSNAALEIRRSGDEAPSRAMDNLFWLGRYAERTENTVRLLRAVVLRLGDDTTLNATVTAAELSRQLLVPLGQVSPTAAAAAEKGNDANLSAELQAAIFGSEPQGLQRLLRRVQRTAWTVRDRLSLDTWRAIHALATEDHAADAPARFDSAGARAYLDQLVLRAAALSGLSAENMTRGNNWNFLDLGRRIERAGHVAYLVRQMLGAQSEQDIAHIQIALEIADSAMTYRYRYLNAFQAAPAIDLLLLDNSNPRGAAFQLATIARHVADLPRITSVQQRQFAKAIADGIRGQIAGLDAPALAAADETGKRRALAGLVDGIDDAMTRLSDAVADTYFQHASRRRAGSARREAR